GGSKYTAKSKSAGADAFDQGALWNEIDGHFAGYHLFLRFGIEPDVTGDSSADQASVDKLANAAAGYRRIVRYDGKVAFALTHQFVDHALGSADAHESADHECRTVRYQRNGVRDGNRFHCENLGRLKIFL